MIVGYYIIDKYNLSLLEFNHFRPKKPVRVKGKNGKRILPPETYMIRKDIKLINAYNNLLSKSEIILPNLPCFESEIKRVGKKTSVHRNYSDSGLVGLRLAGGFWSIATAESRQGITIDGENIIELDVKSQHLGLLHAKAGVRCEHDDPYDLEGYSRADVKKAFLTSISAKSINSAMRSYNLYLRGVRRVKRKSGTGSYEVRISEPKGPPMNLKTFGLLIDLFVRKNPCIGQYLFTDMSKELQAMESNIAMKLIEYFTEADIIVLTVHDSFIVQRKYKEMLEYSIRLAYSELGYEKGLIGIEAK